MHWIVPDLLMFVSSVLLYLAVRKAALNKLSTQFNNLAMFGVPLVIFIVLGLVTQTSWRLDMRSVLVLLVAGIGFAYVSNRASLKSIELAPNAGYSLMLSKSYVVLTTFLAVPLFGARLSIHALLAIGCIVGFSALIMLNRRRGEHAKSAAWLPLAAVAFVGWAFLSLAAKYLFNHGMPPIEFLTYLYIIVTACIALEMYRKRISYRTLHAHPWSFLFIGLTSTGFNFFSFQAIKIAPNVGYVNATNAASIAVVTICSILLFKDDFSWRKIIGVFGVVAGLFLLFLG